MGISKWSWRGVVWRLRKRRQVQSRRFFSGVAVFKGIKKGSSIVCLFFHFSSPACFSPARVKKQSRVDLVFITFSYRTCTTWKKRRSLRTNSFFAKYPKISLGELLLLIYFWSLDVTGEKTARLMSMNVNLVCQGLLAFRRCIDQTRFHLSPLVEQQ